MSVCLFMGDPHVGFPHDGMDLTVQLSSIGPWYHSALLSPGAGPCPSSKKQLFIPSVHDWRPVHTFSLEYLTVQHPLLL